MRIYRFVLALILVIQLGLPSPANSQAPAADAKKDEAKKEGLPLKPARKIEFTTDEGTWISLDVSPDGQRIAFDLLGDLYLLPIAGGEARRITSGMAWDCQPRWSPDGKWLAFISDRAGSDNLWLLRADALDEKSEPKQVTKETDYQLQSPAWTPDSNYLVTRRIGPYPNTDDFMRGTSLWMYHREGGRGVEVVPSRGATQINTGAAFSRDGKAMYFASHPGSFIYDADLGRFQVYSMDRDTGEIDTISSNYGGGLRPVISPDGKWLVYVTRHDSGTGLRIRDMQSGDERWLAYPVQRDDQEGFSVNDTFPGYSFTPDSTAVVFTAGGKIKRVDVQTRAVQTIPFSAKVQAELAPRVYNTFKIDEGPLAIRQMRWTNQTPDGSQIVFSAAGKIWRMDVPSGSPQRITSGADREFEPMISPDGRWVAYVTWSDSQGGFLWKAPLAGGAPVRLTRTAGYVTLPRWSPDGAKLAFVFGSARGWLTGDSSDKRQLSWIAAEGGEIHSVTDLSPFQQSPAFNRAGTRIYYMEGAPPPPNATGPQRPARLLRSARLDGTDKQSHLRIESGVVIATPSPDEAWVLLQERYDAYLAPFPRVGQATVTLNLQSPAVPLKRLTTDGANYASWSSDGKMLTWAHANRFSRIALDKVAQSEKKEDWKAEQIQIALQLPRATPSGTLLLRNARIVTMNGKEVIERGDVLIENNRIASVGPASNARPPAGVKVMDLKGKTIIPGFVDIHSHLGGRGDTWTDQEWSYAANLAYGVTTSRDPSIDTYSVFARGEMVDTGVFVGPRIYATGSAMTTQAVSVNSAEDAENIVRRYKDQGVDSIKQYLQPRRIQRQWLAMAAAKVGVNITAEGGGDLKVDLSMVLDGYTGFEHSLGIVPLYKDVVELIAQAKTTYTPTLVVSYGGPSGQFYWRQRMDIHADEKLNRFTPHETIDRRGRRRPLTLDEDYHFPLIARGARDVIARGGNVGLGSHGEQQGIGAHWEIWMLQSGGATPWEALYAATRLGAEGIGLEAQVGSIEKGKLADMIILNANPLDDIRNTNTILYVVKNGELFAGDTLDQLWPVEKKLPPFFWRQSDADLKALPK